ncbi:hypothetical protein CSA08_02160 [Candidatus Gracilibacteria bacterium]|nr:MAG: hypothetical protein CSA08_02160 [Candidatus Gracilibacteria bacterium]
MNKTYCYIHIPFCESKCKYCRFSSIGSIQKLQIEKYVNHLCCEIELSNFGNSNLLGSIYFGGGTPSTLNNKQIADILKSLKSKYTFDKNIEISLESTPQNIKMENLLHWENLGINRISIGIQSLNNKALKEIGRKSKEEIINSLNIINTFLLKINREIVISIDFIIGLPYVKKGGVLEDIKFILNKYKFINHISVYMLEDYYEKSEDTNSSYEKITYPNSWQNLGISEKYYLGEYSEIKKYLEGKSFYAYEVSNFSKFNKECKHNKAYWNHSNILAYGLGANGFIDNIRYKNSDKFQEYYKGEGIFKEKISKNDLFLEKVMFQLRTSGLEKDIYSKLNQEKIKYFIQEKLLKKDSGKIILTNKGILLLDYIIRELL